MPPSPDRSQACVLLRPLTSPVFLVASTEPEPCRGRKILCPHPDGHELSFQTTEVPTLQRLMGTWQRFKKGIGKSMCQEMLQVDTAWGLYPAQVGCSASTLGPVCYGPSPATLQHIRALATLPPGVYVHLMHCCR